MRRFLIVLPALLLLGAGTSCSGSSTTTLHSVSTDRPATGQSQGGAGNAATCAEVRAGIDAFNAGDYTGTVAHFEKAVPLAAAAARTDTSQQAQDLLDAVRYYATLAPGDYLDASAGSPQFAKYKAITLGQCEGGGSGDSGPSGGITI